MAEELKYKTFWLRFLALIIDGIVVLLLRLAMSFLATQLPSVSVFLVMALIIPFLPFAYNIVLHGVYGQTLGKMLFGVKLVRLDETKKVSVRQAIGRDLIPLCLLFMPQLVVHLIDFGGGTISTQFSIIIITARIVAWMPAIWGLLEVITMLFHSKRRALQDRLTKAVVIRTSKHAFTRT